MALYRMEETKLEKIDGTSFKHEGVKERKNLQAALKKNIQAIAPDCLVISEEFSEWSDSNRRIDLLAIDADANLVVIELKRTETGNHMELQALRYAAMVSTLTFERAVKVFQKYLDEDSSKDSSKPQTISDTSDAEHLDAEKEILAFLGWENSKEGYFASKIKIILVAEDFSNELMTSVLWLNERDLDIICVQLAPYKLDDMLLVDARQIVPLPEAEDYQIKIRQQKEENKKIKLSERDYTQYLFDGKVFKKRNLVLAVVQKWLSEKMPCSYEDLLKAFPQETRTGKLFVELTAENKETLENMKPPRYFLASHEIIRFPDSKEYVLTNQWSKYTLEPFLKRARELKFEISKQAD